MKKPFISICLLVLLVALAACSTEQARRFSAALSGQSEVPAVATDGSGDVTATLRGNILSVTGNAVELSSRVSTAHIHQGPAGENGPVVFPLTVTPLLGGNSADLDGTFTLTNAQVDTLESMGYYVNVHTENNPEGEIRGQLQQLLR